MVADLILSANLTWLSNKEVRRVIEKSLLREQQIRRVRESKEKVPMTIKSFFKLKMLNKKGIEVWK